MSTQMIRSTVVSEEEWLVLQVLSSEQRRQMFDFAEFLTTRREQASAQKSQGDARKRAKFESHFGEIDLGLSTDFDNERIDADLAMEYSSMNEDL